MSSGGVYLVEKQQTIQGLCHLQVEKLPLRRVIGKLKAEQIHKMVVAATPEMQKGDKAYPGHFQKALMALMKDLTKEELEKMEGIRVKWQMEGPSLMSASSKYPILKSEI